MLEATTHPALPYVGQEDYDCEEFSRWRIERASEKVSPLQTCIWSTSVQPEGHNIGCYGRGHKVKTNGKHKGAQSNPK